MLTSLVKFAACCRSFGLMVSPGEVLDCAQSLDCLRVRDQAEFKRVVQAHFIKTIRHRDRFEAVYRIFFFQDQAGGVEPDGPGLEGQTARQMIRALETEADQVVEEGLARDLLDFLKGDPQPFLARVQDIHTREEKQARYFKSNLGQLSAKLGVMLMINRFRKRVLQFQAGEPDAKAAVIRHARAQALGRLNRASSLLSREPVTLNLALRQDSGDLADVNSISGTPFSGLSGAELDQARALMDRLVRKLKDKAGLKYKNRNRGGIDIKKTLRKANRFQGVPLEICYKTRPPSKARIIALCDISGSVWSTARFMLQVLYALEDCFSKIKSFVFVAGLAEVSEMFKDNDIDRAVAQVFENPGINLNERTDYGAVFHDFYRDYGSELTMKTTLIVLGDGRSNWHNPQAHILEKIREKCRRIIWLTPEPGHLWGTGDSEIHTYKQHCHEVRTCMNLNHLADFVTELVL